MAFNSSSMTFHNALLRILLKTQGRLIWIASLRSFSAPQGEQKFLNVILQQHPRSICTDLGCRQTFLADRAQHRRIRNTQKRCDFTDGHFTSSFPLSFGKLRLRDYCVLNTHAWYSSSSPAPYDAPFD
jgi:hypothetical protein